MPPPRRERGSPRAAPSSRGSTPRLRWDGSTPTTVTPPAGTEPPGTDSWCVKEPAPPTIPSPSHAVCIRSSSIHCANRSASSSVFSWPK